MLFGSTVSWFGLNVNPACKIGTWQTICLQYSVCSELSSFPALQLLTVVDFFLLPWDKDSRITAF